MHRAFAVAAMYLMAGGILQIIMPLAERIQGWGWQRGMARLRTAVLFAAVFLAMLVVTRLPVVHFGGKGAYILAGITGLTDVAHLSSA